MTSDLRLATCDLGTCDYRICLSVAASIAHETVPVLPTMSNVMAAVRRLSTFRLGDVYSERALLDYQERLIKSGLFEGASVDADVEKHRRQSAPLDQRTVRRMLMRRALMIRACIATLQSAEA